MAEQGETGQCRRTVPRTKEEALDVLEAIKQRMEGSVAGLELALEYIEALYPEIGEPVWPSYQGPGEILDYGAELFRGEPDTGWEYMIYRRRKRAAE